MNNVNLYNLQKKLAGRKDGRVLDVAIYKVITKMTEKSQEYLHRFDKKYSDYKKLRAYCVDVKLGSEILSFSSTDKGDISSFLLSVMDENKYFKYRIHNGHYRPEKLITGTFIDSLEKRLVSCSDSEISEIHMAMLEKKQKLILAMDVACHQSKDVNQISDKEGFKDVFEPCGPDSFGGSDF